MSLPVTIRSAAPEDAEALLSIYAPYVKHTAITFEYEVPSVEEFRKRIAHTLQHYPYLVAERGINSSAPGSKDEGNCCACTEIAGYAYAGPLNARTCKHICEIPLPWNTPDADETECCYDSDIRPPLQDWRCRHSGWSYSGRQSLFPEKRKASFRFRTSFRILLHRWKFPQTRHRQQG